MFLTWDTRLKMVKDIPSVDPDQKLQQQRGERMYTYKPYNRNSVCISDSQPLTATIKLLWGSFWQKNVHNTG